MSKRKVASRCLVIDASIARAAGSLESVHPRGIRCRAFLMAVRSVCHRMAWTAEIKAEWDKHQSSFALQLLVSMKNLRKLRDDLDLAKFAELRSEITAACADEDIAAIVRKDCHLVEAALASDYRVASMDDAVRKHSSDLTTHVECLEPIVWVNPITETDNAVDWLEQGAPVQKKRRLKRQ